MSLAAIRQAARLRDYRSLVFGMSPLAYWPCDDAVGSTVLRDVVGTRDAALSGDYTLNVQPGPVPREARGVVEALDAASGSFAIGIVPTGSGLNTAGAVALSGWIRTTQNMLLGRIGGGGGYNYVTRVLADGRVEVGHHDGTLTQAQYYAAAGAVDGRWHMITGVRQDDGLTWSAYVDAALIGSFTATAPTPGSDNTHRMISLSSSAVEAVGYLSHNAIFHRALSPAEITALYLAGRDGLTGARTP